MTSPSEELTVDQLAQRTGMTVRNVREWQTLGLLPPPTRRGRTGIYGTSHLARVRRIRQLQSEGLPLELIRRLLEQTPAPRDPDVLRLMDTALEPFQDEEPELIEEAELRRRLNMNDESSWETLRSLGLVEQGEQGSVRVRSSRLLRAVEQLLALGVPVEVLLGKLDQIRQHQDAVAEVMMSLYRDQLWEPFVKAGLPSSGWLELARTMELLRPTLTEATVTIFRLALDDAAQQAIVKGAAQLPGSP